MNESDRNQFIKCIREMQCPSSDSESNSNQVNKKRYLINPFKRELLYPFVYKDLQIVKKGLMSYCTCLLQREVDFNECNDSFFYNELLRSQNIRNFTLETKEYTTEERIASLTQFVKKLKEYCIIDYHFNYNKIIEGDELEKLTLLYYTCQFSCLYPINQYKQVSGRAYLEECIRRVDKSELNFPLSPILLYLFSRDTEQTSLVLTVCFLFFYFRMFSV